MPDKCFGDRSDGRPSLREKKMTFVETEPRNLGSRRYFLVELSMHCDSQARMLLVVTQIVYDGFWVKVSSTVYSLVSI